MRDPCDLRAAFAAAVIAFTVFGPAFAGAVRKVTDSKTVSFDWAMPNGTGSEIFVATSSDQFTPGGNPEHVFQIAVFDPTTGAGTQLTSFTSSLTHVRHNVTVSEDGQWLAFISHGDLVPGQNGNRNPELFLFDRNTSQVTELTNDATSFPGTVTRVAMAGSGNRIAFASNSDLTGGNPQRAGQVFVIDRNGDNLTQLTSAASGFVDHMWISDDGNRIAFSHSGNLTGGNADGNVEVFTIAVGDALPRQITSSTAGNSTGANISGDGSTIVFESTANLTGGNADGGLEIYAADWTTATVSQLTSSTASSRQPWPTDDGQVIFYASNQFTVPAPYFEVFRINRNGTGRTKLTNLLQDAQHPVVSGGGERFAVWLDAGLYTATGTGSGLIQLIDRHVPEQGNPDLSNDATRMCFVSAADPLGTNPAGTSEIFFVHTDGTGLTQLTPSGGLAGRAAMDGAGARVYYESASDPLGQNPDQNDEVFGVNTDGTGVIQYTSCIGAAGEFSGYPDVSDDGSTVVFTSGCDLTGGNADHGGELFRVDPDGQNLTQITSAPSPSPLARYVYWPRLDATGTWVVTSGNANLGGGNPDGSFEVWRLRSDGTGLQQLTSDTTYDSFYPDVSGDGSRVVFLSDADLTGQNSDHNIEVFLHDPAAAPPTRQLTLTTTGESLNVRISRDGRYAYFVSTSRFAEGSADPTRYWLYRYDIDTNTLERSGGSGFEDTAATYWPAVNSDGSAVAYAAVGDPTGRNPDDYWELNLVDYAAPNPPVVSPGPAPTAVSFEPEPGAFRHDVIRGDVAGLSTDGNTVDLGTVLCVEDDSGDTSTVGYEDPDTPAPGQAFFYLFRGSRGVIAGPGSYGTGTNGAVRVAGAGDCGI